MSLYFSKFMLNTYCDTPYFASQLPPGYPLSLVLQQCRAFRRLPPNLKQLAKLSKDWSTLNYPEEGRSIERYYDAESNELDPNTGQALTDTQIDAQWGGKPDPSLTQFIVRDIPIPPGGFPDPETWEEPKEEEPARVSAWGRAYSDTNDIPTREQLLRDIYTVGRERVSETYGIPLDELPTDEEAGRLPQREDEGGNDDSDPLGSEDDDGEIIGIATGELYDGPPIPGLVDQTVQETYRLAYGPGSEKMSPAKRQRRIEMYREALRVQESQRRKKPRA